MDPPNIIFIVFDTLRYDYSKYIEEILDNYDFISYPNVISSAPWTLPSHASMFTGLYPSMHGAHEDHVGRIYPIKVSRLLLTYSLAKKGYRTFDYTANPIITEVFGFKGFDYVFERPYLVPLLRLKEEELEYIDKLKSTSQSKVYILELLKRNSSLGLKIITRFLLKKTRLYNPLDKCYRIIKREHIFKGGYDIIDALKRDLDHMNAYPVFIFINFMEMHEPYSIKELLYPHKVLTELMVNGKASREIIGLWKKGYQRQSLLIPRLLKKLLSILEERKMIDKSLILVTSDHGQLLGEYGGLVNHIAFLYDELLRIPLYVKYPYSTKIVELKDKTGLWFSNKQIKQLILDIVRHNSVEEQKYYSNRVFSESFGIHSLNIKLCSSNGNCKFMKYNARRVALFYKNYKITYNITKKKIEEAKSYGDHLNDAIIEKMVKDILEFYHRVKRINSIGLTFLQRRNIGE